MTLSRRLASFLSRVWVAALVFCLTVPLAHAVPLEITLTGAERQVALGWNAQILEDAPGHLKLAIGQPFTQTRSISDFRNLSGGLACVCTTRVRHLSDAWSTSGRPCKTRSNGTW